MKLNEIENNLNQNENKSKFKKIYEIKINENGNKIGIKKF